MKAYSIHPQQTHENKHIVGIFSLSITQLSVSAAPSCTPLPYTCRIWVCECMFRWSAIEARRRKVCVRDCKGMRGLSERDGLYIRPVSAPLSTCSLSHVLGLVNCGAAWLLCQSLKVAFCSLWRNMSDRGCPTERRKCREVRGDTASKWRGNYISLSCEWIMEYHQPRQVLQIKQAEPQYHAALLRVTHSPTAAYIVKNYSVSYPHVSLRRPGGSGSINFSFQIPSSVLWIQFK